MEIWTPVRAHAEWIALFRETLYGRAALSPRMVVDDEACEVGRWLNRHQDALGHLREYRIACDVHRKFHRRAAYCLRLATSGHRAEALAETEGGGELRHLSRRLVKSFQALKRVIRHRGMAVSWDIDPQGPRLSHPI